MSKEYEDIEDINSEEEEDIESDDEISKIKMKKNDDSDYEEEEEEDEEDVEVQEYEDSDDDAKSVEQNNFIGQTSDSDDDDEGEEEYLQTFEKNIHKKVIQEFHPELLATNYKEIETLAKVVRHENGTIIDPFHKTSTFITKYERARVIGERAKQLNAGAQPFIKIESSLIDGYLIAMKEFEEKKIPFIIQRPLPNGGCEYWRLSDLEII